MKIVAGRFLAEHERRFARDEGSTLPEHRAPRVAAVHGKRAKSYAKREHLLGLGEEALAYITEIIHRRPKVWYRDVDELHALLEVHGDVPLRLAFVRGLAERVFGHEYIAHYLQRRDPRPAGALLVSPSTSTRGRCRLPRDPKRIRRALRLRRRAYRGSLGRLARRSAR